MHPGDMGFRPGYNTESGGPCQPLCRLLPTLISSASTITVLTGTHRRTEGARHETALSQSCPWCQAELTALKWDIALLRDSAVLHYHGCHNSAVLHYHGMSQT